MKHANTIDVYLTKLIGRVPSRLQRPFHWLGIAFQPAGWALFLLMYLAFAEPTIRTDLLLVLVALPFATLIKLAFRRHRPPTIYAENMRVRSYSFPSSHAYASALAGGYFISQVVEHLGWLAATPLVLLPFIIGISRVHLGAHYPSDVIAGWVFGTFALGLIIWS